MISKISLNFFSSNIDKFKGNVTILFWIKFISKLYYVLYLFVRLNCINFLRFICFLLLFFFTNFTLGRSLTNVFLFECVVTGEPKQKQICAKESKTQKTKTMKYNLLAIQSCILRVVLPSSSLKNQFLMN